MKAKKEKPRTVTLNEYSWWILRREKWYLLMFRIKFYQPEQQSGKQSKSTQYPNNLK